MGTTRLACPDFTVARTRLQFLRAVSHAVGAHTDALQPSQHADSSDDDDDDDEQLTPNAASASATASVPGTLAAADTPSRCCEVCLLAPIEGFALVPCGHARFCENCAVCASRSGRGW